MSLSKKLINLFVFPALLLLFSLIFMDSANAAHSGGIVNVSCLHFREEPNTTSASLALAYDGDEVIITGQDGDWYSVVFNGVSGYMFADYVRPVGTLYIEPVSARVTANRVRFRSGPGYEAEVLHYLDTDTQLKVQGIIDCWYEVTYGETTGYMHSDYVEIYYDEYDHLTPGQKIVEYAKQFLDTAGLTGIVLTKLDGTAKGGIVFAIANELKLPVKYVGVGEGMDDLIPFESKNFIEAMFK